MTRRVATRQDLDQLRCGVPGCTKTHENGGPMFLHPRCHTSVGTEVAYQDGVLTIRCKRCQLLVADVAVARTVAD